MFILVYVVGDEDADFYIVEAEVPDQGSETQDWKVSHMFTVMIFIPQRCMTACRQLRYSVSSFL